MPYMFGSFYHYYCIVWICCLASYCPLDVTCPTRHYKLQLSLCRLLDIPNNPCASRRSDKIKGWQSQGTWFHYYIIIMSCDNSLSSYQITQTRRRNSWVHWCSRKYGWRKLLQTWRYPDIPKRNDSRNPQHGC